jgi:hypothetical protein
LLLRGTQREAALGLSPRHAGAVFDLHARMAMPKRQTAGCFIASQMEDAVLRLDHGAPRVHSCRGVVTNAYQIAASVEPFYRVAGRDKLFSLLATHYARLPGQVLNGRAGE